MKFTCSKTRFQVDGVDLKKVGEYKEYTGKLRKNLKDNRIIGKDGKSNNERREKKKAERKKRKSK